MLAIAAAAVAAMSPLVGINVEERTGLVRVLVECSATCSVQPDDSDGVLLVGVAAGSPSRQLLTAPGSGFVKGARLERASGGAILRLETRATPRSMVVAPCGRRVVCIDLDTSSAPQQASARDDIKTIDADLHGLLRRAHLEDGTQVRAGDRFSCRAAATLLAEDAFNLFAYRTVTACGDEYIPSPARLAAISRQSPPDKKLTWLQRLTARLSRKPPIVA